MLKNIDTIKEKTKPKLEHKILYKKSEPSKTHIDNRYLISFSSSRRYTVFNGTTG